MTKVRVKTIEEIQKGPQGPLLGAPGAPTSPAEYGYRVTVEILGGTDPARGRFVIDTDNPATYAFGVEYDLELTPPAA